MHNTGAGMRRMGLNRLLQGVRVLVLLTVCESCAGHERVSLEPSDQRYSPRDYGRALSTWTRETTFLSLHEMDNVLTATATFESWDFRKAYAARYKRDFALSETESKRLLARSLAQSKQFHQFYVALYAQHYDWAELDSDEPAWLVRLVDSQGTSTPPSTLERIKSPGALELTYFPYTTSFRKVYRISFPYKNGENLPSIGKNIEWFGLQFSGPQGAVTINWETL